MGKKMHSKLIIMFIILWCICFTFTTKRVQSGNFCWLVALYCIAAYIRLYGIGKNKSAAFYFGWWFIFSIITATSSIVMIWMGKWFPVFDDGSLHFYDKQSILTLLRAVCLFLAFSKVNIGKRKLINAISAATFGVYLISDQSMVRQYIWQDLFVNNQWQDNNGIIWYSLLVVICVYCACTVIDYIRQLTIERIYLRWVSSFVDGLSRKVSPSVFDKAQFHPSRD